MLPLSGWWTLIRRREHTSRRDPGPWTKHTEVRERQSQHPGAGFFIQGFGGAQSSVEINWQRLNLHLLFGKRAVASLYTMNCQMSLPLGGQITKRHLLLLVWLAEDRLDFSPYSSPSALLLPNWVLLGSAGSAQLYMVWSCISKTVNFWYKLWSKEWIYSLLCRWQRRWAVWAERSIREAARRML